jgi:hypothetical protein
VEIPKIRRAFALGFKDAEMLSATAQPVAALARLNLSASNFCLEPGVPQPVYTPLRPGRYRKECGLELRSRVGLLLALWQVCLQSRGKTYSVKREAAILRKATEARLSLEDLTPLAEAFGLAAQYLCDYLYHSPEEFVQLPWEEILAIANLFFTKGFFNEADHLLTNARGKYGRLARQAIIANYAELLYFLLTEPYEERSKGKVADAEKVGRIALAEERLDYLIAAAPNSVRRYVRQLPMELLIVLQFVALLLDLNAREEQEHSSQREFKPTNDTSFKRRFPGVERVFCFLSQSQHKDFANFLLGRAQEWNKSDSSGAQDREVAVLFDLLTDEELRALARLGGPTFNPGLRGFYRACLEGDSLRAGSISPTVALAKQVPPAPVACTMLAVGALPPLWVAITLIITVGLAYYFRQELVASSNLGTVLSLPAPAGLFSREKFFPGKFNVFKDRVKQTASDIFTLMERYYRRAAVWVAKIDVTSFLANLLKAKPLEDTDDLAGPQRTKPHTATSCSPTNSRGDVLTCSTSKQRLIASLTLSKRVFIFLACVWQPLMLGTVATSIPSSSFSIITVYCFLGIIAYLLISKYIFSSELSQGKNAPGSFKKIRTVLIFALCAGALAISHGYLGTIPAFSFTLQNCGDSPLALAAGKDLCSQAFSGFGLATVAMTFPWMCMPVGSVRATGARKDFVQVESGEVVSSRDLPDAAFIVDLLVCLCAIAFNTVTGERIVGHFHPTSHWKYRPLKSIEEAKDLYLNRFLQKLDLREASRRSQWRAVIAQGGHRHLWGRHVAYLSLQDLEKRLVKAGIPRANIFREPKNNLFDTKKVVCIDTKGRVGIGVSERGNFPISIDLAAAKTKFEINSKIALKQVSTPAKSPRRRGGFSRLGTLLLVVVAAVMLVVSGLFISYAKAAREKAYTYTEVVSGKLSADYNIRMYAGQPAGKLQVNKGQRLKIYFSRRLAKLGVEPQVQIIGRRVSADGLAQAIVLGEYQGELPKDGILEVPIAKAGEFQELRISCKRPEEPSMLTLSIPLVGEMKDAKYNQTLNRWVMLIRDEQEGLQFRAVLVLPKSAQPKPRQKTLRRAIQPLVSLIGKMRAFIELRRESEFQSEAALPLSSGPIRVAGADHALTAEELT